MSSENAEAVAQEVIEKVGKGVLVSKKKIIKKHGYKVSIAKNPKKVTETKSYKKTIKPFLDRMVRHRDKIQFAMDGKDLTKEQYKVLSDAMSKINHDIQLLSGGVTENISVYEWGSYDNLSTKTMDKDISREPEAVDGDSGA